MINRVAAAAKGDPRGGRGQELERPARDADFGAGLGIMGEGLVVALASW